MTEVPSAPAGWYPEGNGQRFWDGQQWTDQRAPLPQARFVLKDVGLAYLWMLFLGAFGAHQFYLRNKTMAVCQLLLFWIGLATLLIYVGLFLLLGVLALWAIDVFTLPRQVRAANRRILGER